MSMKKTLTCINLGCGTNIIPSNKSEIWINIDDYELSANKSFLRCDIRHLSLKDDSVDYIICDQVLEHIAMADVPQVLFHMRRVLKKGGKAVIIVPDFEGAALQWIEAHLNASFDPMKYKYFSEVIYGNQNHDGEYHQTPMCAGYLHYVLGLVGLSKHEISFWPAFGEIPQFPGTRKNAPGAVSRNAQLVVEITK